MNGLDYRTKLVARAGRIGILCNLLLFAFKITLGMWGNSVSVMADAWNNLSDAGSSVISLTGAHMAGKEADEKHPFGHGRIEYIAAFVVAFFVVEVGFKTLQSSFYKIINKEQMSFHALGIIILLGTIAVKLLMGLYYMRTARRIDSVVLKASAADSFQDCIITLATLLSLLVFTVFDKNIDGIVGILVSLLVIWNGISIVRETLEPLIGKSSEPGLYNTISGIVDRHKGIYGSHDLVLHDYGPGRYMGSIHVEMDGALSLSEVHELADHIERQVREETGVSLVIHTDPVLKDKRGMEYKSRVLRLLEGISAEASIHDFQLSEKNGCLELQFDLLLPWGMEKRIEDMLYRELLEAIAADMPHIHSVRVNLDHPYMQKDEESQGEAGSAERRDGEE